MSKQVAIEDPDLLQVVKIHEESHALHHMAVDPSNNNKIWDEFADVNPCLLEILAQLFTYYAVEPEKRLLNAFLELEKRQPLAYRLWRLFRYMEKEPVYWSVRYDNRVQKILGKLGLVLQGSKASPIKTAWVVRPYPHGDYRVPEFLSENMVAIGWPCIGDLTNKRTRGDIKSALQSYYSYASGQSLGQAAGNIYRFKEEIKDGDYVVVPDGTIVYIGIVTGDYVYNQALDSEQEGYPHQRKVAWLYDKRAVKRSLLTGRVFDSLKGQQTVFTTYVDDIHQIAGKRHFFSVQPTAHLKKEYLHKLERGLIPNINSSTFEEAVRVVLKNYFPSIRRLSTSNSKVGDTDLLAELPGKITVRVQVKHFYPDQGELKAWVVDQLAGSMETGDNGIIVTSGRISDEAIRKAEGLPDKRISFIDGTEFVEILFESIEQTPEDALMVFGLSRSIGFI
jgi:predicted Mrr-cat superfamily restriction endonuclease